MGSDEALSSGDEPKTSSAGSTGAIARKRKRRRRRKKAVEKSQEKLQLDPDDKLQEDPENADSLEPCSTCAANAGNCGKPQVEDVLPPELGTKHASSVSAQDASRPPSVDISGSHQPIFLGPATGNVFINVLPGNTENIASLLQNPEPQQSAPPISGCLQPTSVSISGDNNPTFIGETTGNTFTFSQCGTTSRSTADTQLNTSDQNACSIQHEDSTSHVTSPAKVAADTCEAALKTRYMTTGSYVQMIPWVDDDTKHIMDIYTQLHLVSDDDQERHKVLYEDFFLIKTRDGHVIKRIICNGFPGLGKSTLIDKIAYDWALGSVEVLRKYKLVFVLKMHALEQSSELIDAVFDQLIDQKTVSKEDLNTYIVNNPHKVLILLDGFDEFMTTNFRPNAFGSILNMLNRKECTECWVVVTTRPSHFARLASRALIQKPYTHVLVLGFSAEDVKTYVSRFFSKEPRKSQGLFERIQSSNVLSDLAKSPMLLLLMCLLWREDSTLPDTMFRLYSEAICYTFKRKGVSEKEVSNVMIGIGKVALRGLISPVQMLSFQEREFDDKDVLDMAIKVGLLTSQRVLKGLKTHNSIQFAHKTYQEFCAAQYLQHLVASGTDEFQKVLDQMANPLTYEYLLRFSCGDSEVCTHMILQMLQKNQLDDRVLKLSLNCYFESQSDHLPSADFINLVVSGSLCLKNFNSDDLSSFMWFLKRITDPKLGGRSDVLAQVQGMEMLSCNLQSCSKDLGHFISRMTNLSSFHLKWSWLSDSNLKHIASALSNLANLRQLGMAFNKGLQGSVLSGVPGLHKMQQSKLDSSCSTLTGKGIDLMGMQARNIFTLVDLDLSGSTLSGSGESLKLLQPMKHLQKLSLDVCNLSNQDFVHVASLVGQMGNLDRCCVDGTFRVRPSGRGIRLTMKCHSFSGRDMADILKEMANRTDLVEVILDRIDGVSGSAATWAPHLKQLRHLERLLLQDCSLQSVDLEPIVASLSKVATLVELNLSSNKSLRGSGVSWSHLQSLTQLRKLKLDFCSFCSEDLIHLAAVVGSIGSLMYCCIDNTFWVNQTSAGIKVLMMSCPLDAAEVIEVFKALSIRIDLVQLVIGDIRGLSGSSAAWAPHIQQLRHLKKLELINCSLQSTDVEEIVESVRQMPTLVELDLSKNESLRNSGAVWDQIQCMTNLKKLRLVACDLGTEDMKYLAASVGSMKNLVHCSIDDTFRVTPTVNGVKLDLGHYPFIGTDLAGIVKGVSHRADLVELILSSVDGLDGSTSLWFPHLIKLKHLTRLELHRCSLRSEDLGPIAASLSNMPALKELNLSKNESLRDSGASWAHLQSLKQLEKLKVNSCNLNVQDLKWLAKVAGSMDNLVYCTCASGHATFQINPTQTGVRITVSACPFGGQDMADILEAVCCRGDVVGLSVCHMSELGGSAALWSPSLRHLKSLKQLKLSYCSLQSEDTEHLAASVSELPNLAKLDLCGNS